MRNLNRRQFVIASASACGCVMCASPLAAQYRQRPAPSRQQSIDIGKAADYPADGITDKFIRRHRIVVVRNASRLYAMSAVCTHKSCLVRFRDNALKCPCHGSQFSEHGTATDGPARVSLPRYKIELNDKGQIMVDKSKQFAEREWDQPGSFLEIS